MTPIPAKHPAIKTYFDARIAIAAQNVTHEMAVRPAFQSLLDATRPRDWTLVPEQRVEGLKRVVRPDATFRDSNTLPRGYWEAKDSHDDLESEIRKKLDKGYPKSNILFEDTQQAVLFQNGQRVGQYNLSNADEIATLLTRFYGFAESTITGFEQSVAHFQQETPHLAEGLKKLIGEAHASNKRFQQAFADFHDLCKKSLNPNLAVVAVDEMLIQHLLTERLMRTIFDNEEFARRNVVAAEVEKVIDALTSRSFSRNQFLGQLNYFYEAIERAARSLTSFSEKQHFINTIYERFFQGYALKVADTHGIVYTPQPIVDFMCAAVEEVLYDQFGLDFAHPDVCIIDPCTGTGNFIINLLHRVHQRNPAALEDLYRNRLFANEVMLMPYYIASLNIEHTYLELTGKYEPFEGLCFVDTLDLAERVVGAQGSHVAAGFSFLSERNSERVERQKQSKITVVIGNPPYNVGQLNENDNNKNRKYPVIDERVRETYAKDSKATNKNALSDPYVKFFRWATDRLRSNDGVVCYVSNNSFVDQIAFDGMRKHLHQDFDEIYHLDLHGNVRQNPKLSGTTHNVFGIQVGVGITMAIKTAEKQPLPNPPQTREGTVTGQDEMRDLSEDDALSDSTEEMIARQNALQNPPRDGSSPRLGEAGGGLLFYHRVAEDWRKEEKLAFLTLNVDLKGRQNSLNTVGWQELTPDDRHNWLIAENAGEYHELVPIGNKETKSGDSATPGAIFKLYSGGIKTNRDDVVYSFDMVQLQTRVNNFVSAFNAEVDHYKRSGKPKEIDNFVNYDHIKWSEGLKSDLQQGVYADYQTTKIRRSIYRPFTKQYLYFDRMLNERVYLFPIIFPKEHIDRENLLIWIKVGADWPMFALTANSIVDLLPQGGSQCFPFYTYDEDGSNRRENITDWALAQFQARYAQSAIQNLQSKIEKWDIFHYVYGILHHPVYRSRYAANLKRELPRIPFAPEFWPFVEAGRKLAQLHVEYETVEKHPLKFEWATGKPIAWRVEKMRLSKDKTALVVNDSLTLHGIPPQVFEYRLGNRSALDWVIDQYQVSEDKRSGIKSDPNAYSENERYIVELVQRVVTVSVETVKIVDGLPGLGVS